MREREGERLYIHIYIYTCTYAARFQENNMYMAMGLTFLSVALCGRG